MKPVFLAISLLLSMFSLAGHAQQSVIPLDSIRLSDPFILADKKTSMYYMTGTGGMLWKSKDLKYWNGPYNVVRHDTSSWMGKRPMIWAAEIHEYKGKYYYFATFTNSTIKIDTVKGTVIDRRACHVLVGDKPDGPYVPMKDATYLPAHMPTLDATLWIEDDKPYMLYCHEWLQNWNGTVEKIALKPDLSGTTGEGKVLFRASDSPWSREKMDGEIRPNRVTDGPWVFRTQTGRLGMLWTSWVFGDYTQGTAYSQSGTLDGPWIQEKEPVTPPNYGHGMLFRTFDGKLLMSVHSHKEINGRYHRVPHLFEVDDSGDKINVQTLFSGKKAKNKYSDYPIQQVNLNHVTLTDAFWLPKIQTIQKKTIRYAFDKCESEGRLENFITAGRVLNGEKGKTRGVMPFDDTDVYKTIEGAAYSLISAPDPELENYLDSIIAIVKTGQEPDGYLTTWRTIDPATPPAKWVKSGGGRWFDLGSSHELYNSGHLFEAATAHYWATGKRNFLDIAIKNADLLVKVFGNTANYEVPGHQIIETGLIKLFQITDNEDYLKLAKKFLDLRGDVAHRHIRGAYSQDHLPVTQQDEVVGHAVRAVYMYAGMTDIAAIYGEKAYLNAVNNLWNNMVNKKLYITGGLGARHDGEAFGDNYELPNLTAYSETCAAIGSVYWNDRLFRLTGNSKYFDILERTLYNALIAGISLEGTEFFYPNPLESDGKYKFNAGVSCTRHAWFDCSCCPTNLIRFIPYIPNLIYATEDDNLYVNLFMSNKAAIPVQRKTVEIQQETNYPWQGNINLNVKTEKPQKFTLKIRIPGWAKNEVTPGTLYTYSDKLDETFQVTLNGSNIQTQIKNGYIEISKEWAGDNRIELILPMKVRQVAASQDIVADRGLSSIEYGPFVYCVEETDNLENFDQLSINPQADYKVERNSGLLGGINVIYEKTGKDNMFIPYYVWSNRGIGKMKVWLPAHDLSKQKQ